jgi:5-formyltetrahydrofolate cyclo-ligase
MKLQVLRTHGFIKGKDQSYYNMNKAAIRKEASAQRKALSGEEVKRLSEKLLGQFTKLDFAAIKVIHIFLPIEEKNEPDTFLLIRWLNNNQPGIRIIVPKADFKTSLMTHHPYKGEEYLQKNLFNILEPVDEKQFTGKIDMVVVPLLAFDQRGYRVGYGKGFYDRFLEGHQAIKAGFSFFESVDTITDIHANDIRLDLCITPDQIIYF